MTVLLEWLPTERTIFCWVWLSFSFWYLNFAATAVTFSPFLIYNEGFRLLRKAPDGGPTVWLWYQYVFWGNLCKKTALILLKPGSWFNSIIHFIENTGAEIIIWFIFKFIFNFDLPVIPFQDLFDASKPSCSCKKTPAMYWGAHSMNGQVFADDPVTIGSFLGSLQIFCCHHQRFLTL